MKCIRCNSEMTNTMGGNYNCPKCGYGVNDLVYRENISHIANLEPVPNSQNKDDKWLGWICPVCGRGISPFITICPCHDNEITIKY